MKLCPLTQKIHMLWMLFCTFWLRKTKGTQTLQQLANPLWHSWQKKSLLPSCPWPRQPGIWFGLRLAQQPQVLPCLNLAAFNQQRIRKKKKRGEKKHPTTQAHSATAMMIKDVTPHNGIGHISCTIKQTKYYYFFIQPYNSEGIGLL